MLEVYQAYGDYQTTMATLTRELIQEAAPRCSVDHVVRHHDGTEVDLSGEWPQVPLTGGVGGGRREGQARRRRSRSSARSPPTARRRRGPGVGPGKVVEELFEALVQHTLQAPTFVRDYPVETSPLTRAHRSQPGLAEKWDLYIVRHRAGHRVLRTRRPGGAARTGSPRRRRSPRRVTRRRWRSTRTSCEAMEYGMPPTGGMGMGMDRLDDDAHRARHPRDHPVPAGRPFLREQNRAGPFHHKGSACAGIGRMCARL